LFEILLKRNIPAHVIRIILDSYTRQSLCTRWANNLSETFSVYNGVKQGGVLSPILISVYMDELIKRLEQCSAGCQIGHKFVGCLAYADDLTLLSPSITGLKQMIAVCESFSREYHVTFNSKKSMCMCIGSNTLPGAVIHVNGSPIQWKDSVKHLGNIVNSSLTDETDIL
jgi:hypothetical protein